MSGAPAYGGRGRHPSNKSLEPCEDCGIPISRRAESCPYCGRSYRSLRPQAPARGRRWWVVTILLALTIFALYVYWIAVLANFVGGR